MIWIDINEERMPLETDILIQHEFGIEAIHFLCAEWKYWYTGKKVPPEVMKSITHWTKVERG